jgi:hypothetical protein
VAFTTLKKNSVLPVIDNFEKILLFPCFKEPKRVALGGEKARHSVWLFQEICFQTVVAILSDTSVVHSLEVSSVFSLFGVVTALG